MSGRWGCRGLAALGVLLALAVQSARGADLAKRFEISPFVGVLTFDDDLDRKKGAVFGSRFGYWFTKAWETELSIEGQNSEREDSGADASVVQAHLDLLHHFDFHPRLAPYLVAGAGAINYYADDSSSSPDTRFLINYGLGLKFLVTDWLALRADVRQPVTFGGAHFNLMYTGGLSFFFGRAPTAVAAEEKPPEPARVERPAEPPKRPPEERKPPEEKVARPEKPERPEERPPVRMPPEVSLIPRIHFAFDRYTIEPEAQKILANNAEYLKKNPNAKIRIEGHCDERGTVEYNMALGENRARAARQYLLDLGVAADRMTTVTYGKERPLDPGHNEDAWARNRRAEFVEVSK